MNWKQTRAYYCQLKEVDGTLQSIQYKQFPSTIRWEKTFILSYIHQTIKEPLLCITHGPDAVGICRWVCHSLSFKDLTIKYEEKDMQIANHNKKMKAIWRLIHGYRVQREDPWIFIGNIKTNVTEKIIIWIQPLTITKLSNML